MPRSKEPERKLANSAKRPKFVVKRKMVRESVVKRDDDGNLVELEQYGPFEREGFALDWDSCSPEVRARYANQATTLGSLKDSDETALDYSRNDAPIREAFYKFCLDPKDPWHWRLLLYYLADAHFGGRKPKRRKWSPEDLSALLALSQNYPDETNTAIARHLKALRKYRHMGISNLCKLLNKARKLAAK
jgi:hypothetical protein